MNLEKTTQPFIHRVGEPKQINLKQFYQLSEPERQAYIEKLKELTFNELSDTDKGVVFFYFQNWLLEDWPGQKVNFFQIIDVFTPELVENELPQQENADTSTSILDEELPTIDEICEKGINYIKEYLNIYFELDYPDWEGNLKFGGNPIKFIDATSTFMILNELTKVHIHAYKKLL